MHFRSGCFWGSAPCSSEPEIGQALRGGEARPAQETGRRRPGDPQIKQVRPSCTLRTTGGASSVRSDLAGALACAVVPPAPSPSHRESGRRARTKAATRVSVENLPQTSDAGPSSGLRCLPCVSRLQPLSSASHAVARESASTESPRIRSRRDVERRSLCSPSWRSFRAVAVRRRAARRSEWHPKPTPPCARPPPCSTSNRCRRAPSGPASK